MLLKEIIILLNSIILQAERKHDNCEEHKSALYQVSHLITGLEGVVNNKKGGKLRTVIYLKPGFLMLTCLIKTINYRCQT